MARGGDEDMGDDDTNENPLTTIIDWTGPERHGVVLEGQHRMKTADELRAGDDADRDSPR